MTISIETRVSDLYVGNGVTTEFAFPFKIFNTDTDIAVLRNGDNDLDEIVDPSSYYIVLNSDQDSQPGGKVIFYTAPTGEDKFVIQSTVPYVQETNLTNMGDFYPTTLNLTWDKLEAQIQQLLEKLNRCLAVAATSTRTPEEYMALLEVFVDSYDELMALPDELRKLYQELYALLNKEYNDLLASLKDQYEGYEKQAQEYLEKWKKQADQEIEDMLAQAQKDANDIVKELEDMKALIEEGWGYSCAEITWTVEEDIAAGTTITLPYSFFYIVGHHHLRLSWNGLSIYIDDENYEEVGTVHNKSTQIKILFDLKKGDVMDAWTIPLGTVEGENLNNIITGLTDMSDKLQQLSEDVVYHEDI